MPSVSASCCSFFAFSRWRCVFHLPALDLVYQTYFFLFESWLSDYQLLTPEAASSESSSWLSIQTRLGLWRSNTRTSYQASTRLVPFQLNSADQQLHRVQFHFSLLDISLQTLPNPTSVFKIPNWHFSVQSEIRKTNFCCWLQCNKLGLRYLSVLQRVDLGVERRADHFIVPGIGWGSRLWINVKSCQALRVCDGVVLPGFKGHAIGWPLQDPVACVCEAK